MALQKPIEHPRNGAVAAYWRLARVTFAEPVNYVLAGYLNKAAYRAGLDPIQEVTVEIENAKDAPLSRADIYANAKTRPEFAGATDD